MNIDDNNFLIIQLYFHFHLLCLFHTIHLIALYFYYPLVPHSFNFLILAEAFQFLFEIFIFRLSCWIFTFSLFRYFLKSFHWFFLSWSLPSKWLLPFRAMNIYFKLNLLDDIEDQFNAVTILESVVISIEFLVKINFSLTLIASEIISINFPH